MYVTAVSPYGSSQSVSNRLSFEGKEKTGFMSDVGKTAAKAGKKPGVMASISKAMLGTMIGAATLVGGKAMAQAQGPVTNDLTTMTVALTETGEIKPIVFATETFHLNSEGRTLTLFVANTEGDKTVFNTIMGQLSDFKTGEKASGHVVNVSEWDERFIFADFNNKKVISDVGDPEAYKWVKKFVDNVKRNKSNIYVEKVLSGDIAEAAKVAKKVVATIR